jgi:hypothetical protein
MGKTKSSSRGQQRAVLDLERYVPALLVFLANKLTSGASAKTSPSGRTSG